MQQNEFELVAVAVPAGFHEGQTLTVTSPSGVTAQVTIPAGVAPGATFHANIPRPAPLPVAEVVVVMEHDPATKGATTVVTGEMPTTTVVTGEMPTALVASNSPLPRSCCHICTYIMSGLLVVCGVLSFVLLVGALSGTSGTYIAFAGVAIYKHALVGFFSAIFGILASSVVACVGCSYRRQQPGLVIGFAFRVAGWVVFGFACVCCLLLWAFYLTTIFWMVIFFVVAYVLLCLDAEISRADIGFGRRR